MTIPLVLYVIGAIFAVVALVEANGRSWVGWGLLAVCAGLILGKVG